MNTSKGQFQDFSVNPKIKLGFMWATIIALYIYADFFNLMTPNSIQEMMSLETPVGPTSPGILIGFSILLIIPAMMIAGSALMKPVLNRVLNIVFGIIYALISILIIVAEIGSEWRTFFVLYNFVELFVFGMILYTSIKWPRSI